MGKLFRVLAVLALVIGGTVFYFLNHGSSEDENKAVLLPRGSSLLAVSNLLYQQEVIEHPKAFKWLMRLTGGSQKVRAGEFAFRKHMSLLEALRVLYSSDPITYTLTIPEGYAIHEIADLVAEKGLGTHEKFLSLTLNAEAAEKYKINSPSLEGFLYPDTYTFSKVDGEEKIVDTMVQHFFQVARPLMKEYASTNRFSLEQLTTLASIIEKETGSSNERELISSVFHNRLKKRMRLQSDPTTIYGIPNYNGNITKKDLQTWTPYNTYKINGLPPGPIASPGHAALKAALNPAKSDYLFFVASTNGNHLFSKDYRTHTNHVRNEQISPLKKNKRNPASKKIR